MVLFSLVATHSDVDLETVARMSNGSSQVATTVLNDAHPGSTAPVSGTVVLATCNRYELYCEAPSAADVEAARSSVISEISAQSKLPENYVSRAFSTRIGEDVAQHLFAVSSGLDSAVVGEREIAGQVRRALINAQESQTASGPLVRLFEAASRTAKEVGSRTALGSRGLSIVSVALDLATDISEVRDWSTTKVVVFGTGAYAGATMALLQERGCTDVSVYSSSGRAESFTATRGGVPLNADTLVGSLAEADVVIGCSGSDNQVSADDVRRVRPTGSTPLIIVDLALTHDFDPAVASLESVELITLESVRMAAPEEQAEALKEARRIVFESASEFNTQLNARTMDASIVALRKHTTSVLDSEIARVRAQHGCTAAAEQVEFALRRMVRQLLHVPTVRARELAAEGRQDDYISALEALYGIAVDQPAARGGKPLAAGYEAPDADGRAASA